MKKLPHLLLAVLITATTFAQENTGNNENYDKWSIELAGGIHKPTRNFASGYFTNTPSFGQASLGVRYMFNNKFGIKADVAYASLENDDLSTVFKTANYRGSLQGVVNVGNVLDFSDWTNRIGLLVHGGGGYSVNYYDENIVGQDPNGDNMLHIMAGITPQFKISNGIALTADVSAIGNVRQTRTWDGSQLNATTGVDAFAVTTSVGITFYLGENEKHADWVSNNSMLEDKVMELEDRLAKVETDLIDSDQDGVPDYLDREPNTTSGVAVDTKGIAVDKNKNGIPDELESGLDARYLAIKDYNPSTGETSTGAIKELINNGYVNVYFKFNSTQPETYSLEAINYLKQYMAENPTANADLIGYADEIGNPTYNKSLSEKRAKKVYDILVASGVSANRLSHSGNGEDTTVNKDSSEARQLVRRVTFKLK